MILKTILAWLVKIVTGTILSTLMLILVNGKPPVGVEAVLLRVLALGGIAFSPVLIALLITVNVNKYGSLRTLIKKCYKSYLLVFLVTLGLGNALIALLSRPPIVESFMLNFSVAMFCFALGGVLAWSLLFRALLKSAPREAEPENPEIIDRVDF